MLKNGKIFGNLEKNVQILKICWKRAGYCKTAIKYKNKKTAKTDKLQEKVLHENSRKLKHQKSKSFLMFSEGIERAQWHEIT